MLTNQHVVSWDMMLLRELLTVWNMPPYSISLCQVQGMNSSHIFPNQRELWCIESFKGVQVVNTVCVGEARGVLHGTHSASNVVLLE